MIIYDYETVVQPTALPLSLEEVKTALRLDGTTNYDNIINNLIAVVRDYCEMITGRTLINTTMRGYGKWNYDDWAMTDFIYYKNIKSNCYIEFRKWKINQPVLKYIDKNNQTITVDSSKYNLNFSNDYQKLKLIDLNILSNLSTDVDQNIIIDFVAGYGPDESYIPSGLKQAMISQISSLFENVGDCCDCDDPQYAKLYSLYIIPKKIMYV